MKVYYFIVGVLIVVLLSLLLLSLSFRQILQMEMADQFNKQQLLLANAKASNIQTFIEHRRDEMSHVAQLVSHGKRDADYSLLTDTLFNNLGKINKRIEFLDSQGMVVYSRGNLLPVDSDERERIRTLDKPCPDGVVIKQDSRRVYIIAPVCSPGPGIRDVIAYMDIQDMGRFYLSPLKSGSVGNMWLIDKKGDLLFHPKQHDMVGRNLYKADESCLKCHKTFDLEKKMIEGKGEPYGRYIAPTGEDKILAFSSAVVGDSLWFVAVSAPFSEVTLSVSKSLRFYSWVIIVILVAAGGATVMMIYLNSKKEKAEVSAAHEKELEKYSAELEQKVESRTKELSDEKEKLNTIVSAVGSGILLIDKEGKILWINQTMRDIAGKDITGMFCEQICTDCAIVSSYEDHDILTEIMTNLFGFNNRFYQVITAPVKGGTGDVHAYIKLVQDVTEMKRMEEQMMHTEKLAAMERLTSGLANEIGNPLTSVFSFVQVLLDIEEDEFKKETLDTIYSNMSRISEILTQLSDFSKMPSIQRKPCRVNAIIADSLSLIQYDKRVQDIMIVRDLGTEIPEIITDGSKLSQVFVNILLNAVDAMENGGTLTIRSRARDGKVVIDFEDTGAGISSEDLKKIFDPFHTTIEKGSGIGLAVSQKIIRQLNGSLTAESKVGKGSRFEVTLPISDKD